jgi:CubicO group peptidase (beta-lactamase class C family)
MRSGGRRREERVRVGGHELLEAAAERLAAFASRRVARPGALPGLAVGLIGPGGWRRELAVGVTDVASGRPLAPDALMPVASIGKAMTAAALLREHQAGRLDLDAPVHEHLPWLPLATPFGPISVRHLLSHTAGIVGGMEGSPSPHLEALALVHTPPGWPPGERFRYSDVGYAVLGLVLERVAACSYAEALRRHVLDPCAMAGSEAVTTAEAQARAATGHVRLAGGAMVPAPWVPTTAGSGATLCTAPDLGRFLRAVVAGDPPLLGPAVREAMLTPVLPIPDGDYGYGLGLEVDDQDGYRRVGHQGDCPGFCSYAFGCPETGVGVAALGNGPWRPPSDPDGAWAVVEHGLALLRAAALGRDLPPDPPDPPAAVPEPAGERPAARAPAGDLPAELSALTGTYATWNPWLPQVVVRPAGGGLVLVWPEGETEPLTPLPGGGFRLGDDPDSPDRVRFQDEVDGRPMRAVVSGWPYDRVD